ncbi:hypothetical protein J2Y45_003235 [Dyadobacter sp. BE34]|uniref:Uncharacterized protein n=1 Tax=Dyadobacter fermentans TaxID=94254 RepID=A0ABU1QY08_9BACT|nr:hypothetical protein [Dyadobacter fermentans]MDR7043784.1 hypothetical protein [Dyadobacter sp. BE242]MDR7198095.1 hypothetical protein [Dyadobacter sp. BE34]MDR7216058.1 hypothetical protein [Dyadobacter sp. BE31]MDR7264416.1 hypothetical protein [Dyadobacter sp. BE32]
MQSIRSARCPSSPKISREGLYISIDHSKSSISLWYFSTWLSNLRIPVS